MAAPAPDGYRTVTPYLFVEGAITLLDFLARAFDGTERQRLDRPDGSLMPAEIEIGDSLVMVGEAISGLGPMPASIYLYVGDCDAMYDRALDAGADSIMEPMTMPHNGERYGGVKDPTGNIWWIATRLEEVSPEEEARRVTAGLAPAPELDEP